MRAALIALLIVFLTVPTAQTARAARDDIQLLIISGLGGEKEFSTIFHNWSAALREAAMRSGLAVENIVYLAEDPARDPQAIQARADKETISVAINDLAARVKAHDDIYIFLFGHGTGRGKQAFFNIPGPDISAYEFSELLAPLAGKRLVLVNATSSSGPFVRALSAPGRVVITATSKATERYFPEFGGYFVAALDSDSADADKDNRVSILEAFNYAKSEVKREYDKDKRLLTEHALLDDNADKEGSREPALLAKDGSLAASFYLYGERHATGEPQQQNPRLRTLLEQKADIETRILGLKRRKAELDVEDYYKQLEQLLLELAHNLRARRAEEDTVAAQEEKKS